MVCSSRLSEHTLAQTSKHTKASDVDGELVSKASPSKKTDGLVTKSFKGLNNQLKLRNLQRGPGLENLSRAHQNAAVFQSMELKGGQNNGAMNQLQILTSGADERKEFLKYRNLGAD